MTLFQSVPTRNLPPCHPYSRKYLSPLSPFKGIEGREICKNKDDKEEDFLSELTEKVSFSSANHGSVLELTLVVRGRIKVSLSTYRNRPWGSPRIKSCIIDYILSKRCLSELT